MRTLKDFKKWIWIPIVLLLIAAAAISMISLAAKSDEETLFNLNERDIVLEVGGTQKVQVESEKVNVKTADLKISWRSSKPSVASIDEDGTILAASGGEAKITAIVEYKEKEYSTSCVVTVKDENHTYSTYKIRWFTQKGDRRDYEVKEETFEREVGSSVQLTELDAKKNLPVNYELNTEKSRLTGTVQKKNGACILEVYFDVAEISYTVDYYYESATALGTYPEKESKTYKAYAFSKVEVTEKPKTGFVLNKKVKGSVLSNDSVISGTKLKVFCDRIRSKVTINYISGKASAAYDTIYGYGFVNAPEDVLKDSIEYKIATYVNGKKKNATLDLVKTFTKDTTIDFKLAGSGFTYSSKDGVSTILNETTEADSPSYAMLKGKSNVLYLSATYQITGSTSNRFGVTLSDGKTSREIRFKVSDDKVNGGIGVKMDNTLDGGILTAQYKSNQYDHTCTIDDEVFVWAQYSNKTNAEKLDSAIKNMMSDRLGGDYQIQWAVWEGVLYARIEDETVLRLPLERLNPKWNRNTKFEMGLSSLDESAWGDDLRITNVNFKTGNEAKKILHVDSKIESIASAQMGYDVISGKYIPASKAGAAYVYGKEAVNTGISATVNYRDMYNTASAAGITVKMGDKSVQYVIEGMNKKVRRHENHKWGSPKTITTQILEEATPMNADGTSKIEAFVKDGYLYVLYNGVEAQCVNMLNLFSDYKADSKVAVGIYAWDSNNGLAEFSNVKILDEKAITEVCSANGVKEWGYYVEPVADSLEGDTTYDFSEGVIAKDGKKASLLTFWGETDIWQIEGIMRRPLPETLGGKEQDALMGIVVEAGDSDTKQYFCGRMNSFQTNNPTYRTYSDSTPSIYAFNSGITDRFFNANNTNTRTQDAIKFKAVVYEDILYVWFTEQIKDSAGNNVDGRTGLCWRIPLTEEQFGGFAENSNYRLSFYFYNNSPVDLSVTDVKVKMGYQVTGQQNFTKDQENKQYSFTEAISEINKNILSYSDKDANYFKLKNISGNLAEEILNHSWAMFYKESGAAGKDSSNMTYDAGENKLTLDNPNGSNASYAYFSPTTDTQVLNATVDIITKDGGYNPAYGITVKSGEKSAQVLTTTNAAGTSNNIRIQLNHKWGSPHYITQKSTDSYGREILNWTSQYTTGQMKVGAVVKDGTLYVFYNEVLTCSVDLYKILPGYVDGDAVQLGVVGWDVKNEPVEITDISYNVGNDAVKDIVLTGGCDLEIYWKDGVINREGVRLKYNGTNNTIAWPTNISKNPKDMCILNAATSMSQTLEARFTITQMRDSKNNWYTGNRGYGITLVSGGQSRDFWIRAKSLDLIFTENHSWDDRFKQYDINETVKMTGLNINEHKFTHDHSSGTKSVTYTIKAVIHDGMLYIFYNDSLRGTVALNEMFDGYKVGDEVQIGFSGWENQPNWTFSEISCNAGQKAVDDLLARLKAAGKPAVLQRTETNNWDAPFISKYGYNK